MTPQGQTKNGGIDGSAIWADCPGCRRCEKNGGYVLRRGSWRPTSAWEPVLMLAKSADYFADGEPVKQVAVSADRPRPTPEMKTRRPNDTEWQDNRYAPGRSGYGVSESGANLRDVWTIAAEPLKARHYAAYPTELVFRCLASSTSAKGYCCRCGGPWVRVVESRLALGADGKTCTKCGKNHGKPKENPQYGGVAQSVERFCCVDEKTLGWRPSCTCSADIRPGRVLDPYCGSGRTGMAAQQLGLDFTGCELNPEYAAMAREHLAGLWT